MIRCNDPVGSWDADSGRMARMIPEGAAGREATGCGWLAVTGGVGAVQPAAGSKRHSPGTRMLMRRVIPVAGLMLDIQNVNMPVRAGEYCGRQVFLAQSYLYSLVGYIALFKPFFSSLS